MQLLNIGCGYTFHPDWINLDLYSSSPYVKAWDIREGLPFASESIDVCYSSHVLEHMSQPQVKRLLAECYRVLKPTGCIRVVVPDLERIAKEYLAALDRATNNIYNGEADYDWMMIELCDQMVRTHTGGDMYEYLNNTSISNRDFIESRMGESSKIYDKSKPLAIKNKLIMRVNNAFFNLIAKFLFKTTLSEPFLDEILGETIFRSRGEVHRWMYDRFSLKRLLSNAGFQNFTICKADESRINNFASYQLDTVAGKLRKADSIFVEAVKS